MRPHENVSLVPQVFRPFFVYIRVASGRYRRPKYSAVQREGECHMDDSGLGDLLMIFYTYYCSVDNAFAPSAARCIPIVYKYTLEGVKHVRLWRPNDRCSGEKMRSLMA